MKNIVIMLFCMFAAVACNSCAPQHSPVPPVPTVTVDAGPAPPPNPLPVVVVDAGPLPPQPNVDPGVRDACAAISKVGCAEGGPSCPGRMQLALAERITMVPLDCLVGVHTKADVHACGRFIPCL